jgi:hypothetical protein
MHFFALMNGMETRAYWFDALEPIEAPERLLLGEERPADPVVFRRKSGSQPRDLLGETYGVLKLVSDRFPIRLQTPQGDLEGCTGLSVLGRCGPIDRSKSHIIERLTRKHTVLYAELGLFVDPDTWDGADLFVPRGASVVCVTQRAKDALESAGVTNVRFVPNEEYQLMLHRHPPARSTV